MSYPPILPNHGNLNFGALPFTVIYDDDIVDPHKAIGNADLDARKAHGVAVGPIAELGKRLLFLQMLDLQMDVTNVLWINRKNQTVMAMGGAAKKFLGDPKNLPKGFEVKKISKKTAKKMLKEMLDRLIKLIEAIKQDKLNKEKSKPSQEKNSPTPLALQYNIKNVTGVQAGPGSPSMVTAHLVSCVVFLRDVILSERQIIERMWRKFGETILAEQQLNAVRTLEDELTQNQLKADQLQELLLLLTIGGKCAMLEFCDPETQAVVAKAMAGGSGTTFSTTTVTAAAA